MTGYFEDYEKKRELEDTAYYWEDPQLGIEDWEQQIGEIQDDLWDRYGISNSEGLEEWWNEFQNDPTIHSPGSHGLPKGYEVKPEVDWSSLIESLLEDLQYYDRGGKKSDLYGSDAADAVYTLMSVAGIKQEEMKSLMESMDEEVNERYEQYWVNAVDYYTPELRKEWENEHEDEFMDEDTGEVDETAMEEAWETYYENEGSELEADALWEDFKNPYYGNGQADVVEFRERLYQLVGKHPMPGPDEWKLGPYQSPAGREVTRLHPILPQKNELESKDWIPEVLSKVSTMAEFDWEDGDRFMLEATGDGPYQILDVNATDPDSGISVIQIENEETGVVINIGLNDWDAWTQDYGARKIQPEAEAEVVEVPFNEGDAVINITSGQPGTVSKVFPDGFMEVAWESGKKTMEFPADWKPAPPPAPSDEMAQALWPDTFPADWLSSLHLRDLIHEYNPATNQIVVRDGKTAHIVTTLSPDDIEPDPEAKKWLVRWGQAGDTDWQPIGEQPQVSPPQDTIKQALQQDPAARSAYEALSKAGGHVYVVGGAVRDAYLNKQPKDIDLMVIGLPGDQINEALSNLPGRVDYTGQSFGVYRYRQGNFEVEVAMPRAEVSTGAGHKDFNVQVDHTLSPEDDLLRRDFTANALAYNIDSDEIVDPFGGQADLRSGTLRTVSPQSFEDDPLRIVRALVAYARHGLKPDEATLAQMSQHADKVRHLPGERLSAELDKLLSSDNPGLAFRLADETGVLDYLLPEVATTRGVNQFNPHHELDVSNHLYEVLDNMGKISNDPDLRLAALLHDIGKPDSMWLDEQGNGHFYEHPDVEGSADHEKLGAEYARSLLRRLRYPEDRVNRITKLIDLHMFPAFNTEKGARRFLHRAGSEKMAYDLLRLRMADAAGKSNRKEMDSSDQTISQQMFSLLHKVVDETPVFGPKDLAISGNDLMKIGIEPGPKMGEILRELVERVLNDPSLNNEADLLGLARQLHE